MKNLPFIILLCVTAVFSSVQGQSAAPANTPAPTTATTAESAEPTPGDPATAFSAAVAAYGKGDYGRANDLFTATEKKSFSGPLEYNFGNSSYQAHDYGAAILHYLRALSLDPRDPDARQNLALARKAANVTPPDETHLDHFSALVTRNTWAWVAVGAGWVAVYLAFLPQLFRWRGALPWLLCAAALALAITAGVGLWGAQQHAHEGVILHADTPLNLSPTTNSPSISMLQPGEVAQTLEEHGNYFKIRTTNGQLGWVEAAKYSPVWN